ncbi:hypothetical protein BASA81_003884 [Batrachochytrium salamandrivorans]|nr:hypothetical protein BASA81_003884 [Batrachochytrium salamandrivorans]
MSYFEVGDYGKTVALLNQVLLPLGPKPNEPQARLRRAEAHICMLHSLVEAQTDLAWVKQHSPYLAQEAVGLEAKLKLATAARDRPLYSSSFVPMPQFTKLDEHVNTTKLFTKLCELRQGEGGYCGTKIRVVECGFGIQGGQRVVGKFYGGKHAGFHGQVVTLRCFEDNSLFSEMLDQPGKGKVLVVDGGGSTLRALFGDQMADKAVRNQWAGVVINA